jgi:hypothetical protein
VGLDLVRAEGWRARQRPAAQAGPEPVTAGPQPPPAAGAGATAASLLGRPAAVAAVALLALIPVLPRLPFVSRHAAVPAFFTSPAVKMIPPGAVALTFPYDRAPHNQAMLWQAVTGMRFRIIGGEVFVPGPDGRSTWRPDPAGPPILLPVLRAGTAVDPGPPPTSQQAVAALRQLCARYRIDVVLVRPGATYGGRFAHLMRRALGEPPLRSGGMDVWTGVQARLRAHG